MKVAVLSTAPGLGKTYLLATLAGVYARSQRKSAAILSTGNIMDNIDIIDSGGVKDASEELYVFKSILDNTIDRNEELLNFGVRQGLENVYIYDTMHAKIDWEEMKEFFIDSMKKIPVDLTLVEVTADCPSDLKDLIMSNCDCFLMLTDLSQKGLKALKEFTETAPPAVTFRTGFVISKYDTRVTTEKKISTFTTLDVKRMMYFPYNVAIARLALNGILDQAAYNLVSGDPELIPIRMRILELMQFIFDTDKRKIIRGVDKWSK